MRISLGDIVPLNVPPGADTSYHPSGWYLGADGNWHWSGKTLPPNLGIPITTGPQIPSNAGWAFAPDNTLVWTGPGNPSALPGSMTPPGTIVQNPASAIGPMRNWTPQPILPDSMLPPALQRSNPLIQPAQFTPNRFDFQVIGRAKKWQWVATHGGLKSCCRIPELGAPIYDIPPTEEMPANGFEFNEMNGVALTDISGGGPFTGVDTLILSIQVPSGYDGVINRFVAQVTDVNGYTDFSSAIVWRLQYGARYAKNLGACNNTFGSFSNAIQVPGRSIIRVISGQTIQVFASIPAGSPVAGGSVSAGVFGWFYPRR